MANSDWLELKLRRKPKPRFRFDSRPSRPEVVYHVMSIELHEKSLLGYKQQIHLEKTQKYRSTSMDGRAEGEGKCVCNSPPGKDDSQAGRIPLTFVDKY